MMSSPMPEDVGALRQWRQELKNGSRRISDIDELSRAAALEAAAREEGRFRPQVVGTDTVSRDGRLIPLDAPSSNGTAPKRRIVLTTEDELEALEPMEWRVEGILPEQGLGLLFGASESFKSFLALHLAACIGTGRDFHGHAVTQGISLYVAAEGFFGLQPRYLALKQHFNFDGPLGICFLRHGIDVRRGSKDLRELRDAIGEVTDDPIAVTFLDTLNRNFVGNENAPEDMAEYLKGCDEIKEMTGGAVISIHHTGHIESERGRGHSSLRAALDAEYKCVRDGDDRVTFECSKMKDGPHFKPLTFDMIKCGPSLVPLEVGTVDVRMTRNRATALEVLPLEGGLTRKQWESASGLKPGTFRHALDWFVSMAYVRQSRDGKYTRNEAGTQALVPQCHRSATTIKDDLAILPATQGGI